MTLRISYKQSFWVRGENTSLVPGLSAVCYPSPPLDKEHISKNDVIRESEGGRTVNLKNISIVTTTPLARNARIIPEWARIVGIHS